MNFQEMKDENWQQFVTFAEKNFVSSHPTDRIFNEFYFRRPDGSWSIQLAMRDNGSISAVNMMIEVPGRLGNVKLPLTWMSSAFAENDMQNTSVGGLLLFRSHRTLPFVACSCANTKTLPINEALGLDIHGLNMRRFVYVFTSDCLQIVRQESRKKIKNTLKPLKTLSNNDLHRQWVNIMPDDFDELWKEFSETLSCVVERSHHYMDRRYVNAPYQDYHLLSISDGNDKLQGFSVVRFQQTMHGECARIVDFVARPGSETAVWLHILHACMGKNCLYADFIVIGTGQDWSLKNAGFTLANDQNGLEDVPNLLSPIDYRRWSYTFHISGTLPRTLDGWREKKKVWFTKGDGDRDFPTPENIAEYQANK